MSQVCGQHKNYDKITQWSSYHCVKEQTAALETERRKKKFTIEMGAKQIYLRLNQHSVRKQRNRPLPIYLQSTGTSKKSFQFPFIVFHRPQTVAVFSLEIMK